MLITDIDVGQTEKAPAEAADQIEHRIEQRDRAPERRQYAGRIERAAEERQRRDNEQRHDLQLLEGVGPDAENKAKQAEAERGQDQKGEHPDRMHDLQRHEQGGRRQDDQAENDRLGRRRADRAEHDLERRHRRRKNFVYRADEAGKVDAERGVDDALGQQHQHHQPRHDERAVGDAFDLTDARADSSAEHNEIERGGNHRRDDALQQGAPGARHLVSIDRADGIKVHGLSLTRPTKMSSSDVSVVCRSLNLIPARLRSSSNAVMSVRSPWVS